MKKRSIQNKINRKPIKGKKIGCIMSIYLQYCGKRDYKKGVIRKNSEQYTSPFIQKETSLCLVDIQNEIKMLNEVIINILIDIRNSQLKIHNKNKYIKNLSEQCSDEKSDIIDNDRVTEDKILETLNISIDIIESFEQSNILFYKKELNITRIRCIQLYDILVAKLSVYWTGVLKKDKKSLDISPLLNVQDLLSDIRHQIEEINILGSDKFEKQYL